MLNSAISSLAQCSFTGLTLENGPLFCVERWRARIAPLLRLYRLSPERRTLLLQASVLLTAASACVSLCPFKLAIRFGSVSIKAPRDITAADCVWAVEAAASKVPWRTMCIEKGLTVQRMLRTRGIDAILHYGARLHPESGKLEAHVWVTVEDRPVIGGEEAGTFAAVASYP